MSAPRPPRRVLMTVDAVGGVWRYAMDLGTGLRRAGVDVVYAGLGPPPTAAQATEATAIGTMVWLDAPLDWTAADERDLDAIPAQLADLVHAHDIDLVHLNLPSQACGLVLPVPVVVVSHSCVVTWFHAVRGTPAPDAWQWQRRRNRAGFDAATAVLAPSHSHAAMLRHCYGPIARLEVVHNAVRDSAPAASRGDFVFAAGRWWDDGKNGARLDEAAAALPWPVRMAGPTNGPGGQTIALRHAEALGEIGNAEVRQLMAAAAIVVSPSLYEPFGLAALEAASTGAALVLADIPTYRELWDGAALFADPRRSDSIAAAIGELAADRPLRERLGGAARRRAEQFTLDAQVSALLATYATAMAPSATALTGTG